MIEFKFKLDNDEEKIYKKVVAMSKYKNLAIPKSIVMKALTAALTGQATISITK